MSKTSFGFIGGGRVTRTILKGFKQKGQLPVQLVVSDANEATLAKLRQQFPTIETVPGNNTRPATQDIVFLAVPPPAVTEVTGQIKGSLRQDALLVSLAPKFTIAKLTDLLGGYSRVARVIPNAPSIIGSGYNLMAFGSGVTAAAKQAITDLLSPLGDCVEVAESKLEGFALLTAMGPTYLWFQLQTLRELAESFGLTKSDVTPALKRMVCGSARTLLESGLPPAEVMDLIPVKPLNEMEASVTETYRTRLPELFQKIKP
jgi:pyrroline-5-carboxylate reductase